MTVKNQWKRLLRQNSARGSEQGFLLTDCLISLPLLAALLLAFGMMLGTALHAAFCFWADAELHQELQLAFQRIVRDAELSYDIQPHYSRKGAVFYQYRVPDSAGKVRSQKTAYWLYTVKGTQKLVWRDVSQPLTGNYSLAEVEIEEFSCESVGTRLYELRLVGRSRVTGHRYALATRIALPLVPAGKNV